MEKISRSHCQLGKLIHSIFFLIGLSIGVTASVYYKTVLVLLQRSLSDSSSSIFTKPPQLLVVLPESEPASEPPPSPPAPPPFRPTLLHGMGDNEVFYRALSPAPRRRGSEPAVVPIIPKVAFMFLTKGPMPLTPLWERFFKGYEGLYTIYVHTDPLYVDSIPASSVFFKRRIPSQVSSSSCTYA